MTLAIKREGCSLSNSIQNNIETNSKEVSITVDQTKQNQQTVDVDLRLYR